MVTGEKHDSHRPGHIPGRLIGPQPEIKLPPQKRMFSCLSAPLGALQEIKRRNDDKRWQRDRQIAKEYEQGTPVAAIADMFNISLGTVYRVAEEWDLPARKRGGAPVLPTGVDWDHTAAQVARGMSLRRLAVQHKCTVAAVQAGLERREREMAIRARQTAAAPVYAAGGLEVTVEEEGDLAGRAAELEARLGSLEKIVGKIIQGT